MYALPSLFCPCFHHASSKSYDLESIKPSTIIYYHKISCCIKLINLFMLGLFSGARCLYCTIYTSEQCAYVPICQLTQWVCVYYSIVCPCMSVKSVLAGRLRQWVYVYYIMSIVCPHMSVKSALAGRLRQWVCVYNIMSIVCPRVSAKSVLAGRLQQWESGGRARTVCIFV